MHDSPSTLIFLTLITYCTSLDDQILSLHHLPTSSSGLRPVLDLLNTLTSSTLTSPDTECPRNVTLTLLPNLGFDENVGFCPMSFGFIKLEEGFVPNLFLTAQCRGECRSRHCSSRGPHKCTEIFETVSSVKVGEIVEVVTKRIPVGCVCASRKAVLKRTQLPVIST